MRNDDVQPVDDPQPYRWNNPAITEMVNDATAQHDDVNKAEVVGAHFMLALANAERLWRAKHEFGLNNQQLATLADQMRVKRTDRYNLLRLHKHRALALAHVNYEIGRAAARHGEPPLLSWRKFLADVIPPPNESEVESESDEADGDVIQSDDNNDVRGDGSNPEIDKVHQIENGIKSMRDALDIARTTIREARADADDWRHRYEKVTRERDAAKERIKELEAVLGVREQPNQSRPANETAQEPVDHGREPVGDTEQQSEPAEQDQSPDQRNRVVTSTRRTRVVDLDKAQQLLNQAAIAGLSENKARERTAAQFDCTPQAIWKHMKAGRLLWRPAGDLDTNDNDRTSRKPTETK